MGDATISFFEAKYIYHFWRPVTPAELTDSDRLSFSTKTAPDPSYPGAHSATSSAAATVLAFYFRDKFTFDVTSEVLPGVTRHFTSFSAAKREACLSRIYAGQHFRLDHLAGLRLGREVSRSIEETILLYARNNARQVTQASCSIAMRTGAPLARQFSVRGKESFKRRRWSISDQNISICSTAGPLRSSSPAPWLQ